MSDSSPASFVKVSVQAADDETVAFTAMTDGNGRYQFDSIVPGKYIISPRTSDTQSRQYFKPLNRSVSVELGQKTTVSSFQVFGGSISGQVKTFDDFPVPLASIIVDGVEKTQANEKGVYYVNFDGELPSKHRIEAVHEEFIFDPLTVTVTEEMRKLPDI